MSLQNRLEKLEQATGINEPCEACAHSESLEPRIKELAERLGVQLPEAFGPEMAFPCYYCTRVIYLKVGAFSLSERVLFERVDAAFAAGTLLCAPENSTLHEEIMAACDRVSREEWGEHFADLRALTEITDREVV